MTTVTNTSTVKVNTAIEIDLKTSATTGSHVFIGVKFIDATGSTVTPTGGTYTLSVLPIGMDTEQSIVNGTNIDATLPLELLSYAANTDKLIYTPNAIAGADRITITTTVNET